MLEHSQFSEAKWRAAVEAQTDVNNKQTLEEKTESFYQDNLKKQKRQETLEKMAARKTGEKVDPNKVSLAAAESRIAKWEQQTALDGHTDNEINDLKQRLENNWTELDEQKMDVQADRDSLDRVEDEEFYTDARQQVLDLAQKQRAYESLLLRLDRLQEETKPASETTSNAETVDTRAKNILETRAIALEAFNNNTASFNPDDFLTNLRTGLQLLAAGETAEARTALRFKDLLGKAKDTANKSFDAIAADEARLEAEKKAKTELEAITKRIQAAETSLKQNLDILFSGFDRSTNWGQLSTASQLFQEYPKALTENASWSEKLNLACKNYFQERLANSKAEAIFVAALARGESELSSAEKNNVLTEILGAEIATLNSDQQAALSRTLLSLIEQTMKYKMEAAAEQASKSRIDSRSGTETLAFGGDQIKLDKLKATAEKSAQKTMETAFQADRNFNPDLANWTFLQWALNGAESPYQLAVHLDNTAVDFDSLSNLDKQNKLDEYTEAFFGLNRLKSFVQREFSDHIASINPEFQAVIQKDFQDIFVARCADQINRLQNKIMEIYRSDPGIKKINEIGFKAVSSTGTDKNELKDLTTSFEAIKNSIATNPTVQALNLQPHFDNLYLNSIADILNEQQKFKGEYEKLVSAHDAESLGELLRNILRHADGVNPSGNGAMAKTLELYVHRRVDRALQSMRERSSSSAAEKENTEKTARALQELFNLFYTGNKESVFNADDSERATISLTDMTVNVENMTKIVRGEEMRKIIEDMGYNELVFGEDFSWHAYDFDRFDFYHNRRATAGVLAQTEYSHDPNRPAYVENQKGGIVADYLKEAFDILRKDFRNKPNGLPELYLGWETKIKAKYADQKNKLDTWQAANEARIQSIGNAVEQATARKEFDKELAKRQEILAGYNISQTEFLNCSMYGGTFDGRILMNFLTNYSLSDSLDQIAPAQDLDTPIEEWDDNNPRYIIKTIAETMLSTLNVARQANNLAMNIAPGQAPMSTKGSGEWGNTTENMIYQEEKIKLQDGNLALLMSHNLPKGEYEGGSLKAINYLFQYHAPETGSKTKDWHTEIWPVRQFQQAQTELGHSWNPGDLYMRAEQPISFNGEQYQIVIQPQAKETNGTSLRRSANNIEDKVFLAKLNANGNIDNGSIVEVADAATALRYRMTYKRIDPEFCLVDKDNSPFEKERKAYEVFMGNAGHGCWTPDFFPQVRCQIDSYANGATQGSTFNLFLMQQRHISAHSYGGGYEKMLMGWDKMIKTFLSPLPPDLDKPEKMEENLRKLDEEATGLGSALSLIKANTVGGDKGPLEPPSPGAADFEQKMESYNRRLEMEAFLGKFRYIREAFMQKVKYRQAEILTSFFPSWDRNKLPMGLNQVAARARLKTRAMDDYITLAGRYFDALTTRDDTAFGKDENPTEFSVDLKNFLNTYRKNFLCNRPLTPDELQEGRADSMRAMVENIAKGPSLVFANYDNGRDFSSWKPLDIKSDYVQQLIKYDDDARMLSRSSGITMETLLDPFSPFFPLCDAFFGDIYEQFKQKETKVEEGKK